VRSAHDCSEGGLGVALAEMALAGRLGVSWNLEAVNTALEAEQVLFSESAGRIVLEVRPADRPSFEALFAQLPLQHIGTVTAATEYVALWGMDEVIRCPVEVLEMAWRGEIAPTPVPLPVGAKPASLLRTAISKKPKTIILHANGSNRDRDAALAVDLAGGEPEIVHINQLFKGERHLQDYAFLIVPGGFSYGDDLGAGVRWSLDLRERLSDQLEAFVSSGKPVLGICNGFQTLVKAGMLPGEFSPRTSTLTYNERGHFECRWVTLNANTNSSSFWMRGLEEGIDTPVAHGEGRFLCDEATLKHLEQHNLIALTYSSPEYPANPNGSLSSIAGITNAAGNVLGLMPHPENHVFGWQHPRYHRGERGRSGLTLFQNAIEHALK
jgi:phosphoribosylformylglycinamidine synthase I